jgi:hypothetical protein
MHWPLFYHVSTDVRDAHRWRAVRLLEQPPPGCNAVLTVLNIVSTVAEAEILAMYDNAGRAFKVGE